MSGAVTNTPGLVLHRLQINDLKIPLVLMVQNMTLAYAPGASFWCIWYHFDLYNSKENISGKHSSEQEITPEGSMPKHQKVVSFHLVLENEGLDKQPLRTIFNF